MLCTHLSGSNLWNLNVLFPLICFNSLNFQLLQWTQFCTLQFITYPDVVYKVATTAILIQTRGVQSVFSLEMIAIDISSKLLFCPDNTVSYNVQLNIWALFSCPFYLDQHLLHYCVLALYLALWPSVSTGCTRKINTVKFLFSSYGNVPKYC